MFSTTVLRAPRPAAYGAGVASRRAAAVAGTFAAMSWHVDAQATFVQTTAPALAFATKRNEIQVPRPAPPA
ncbi:MAG: hypothetical protein QOI42_1293 [Frankiaceae bacterium]|jgi:hypothetical protein|nr:hypothetical protein [Frankiaceae bacterium]